MTEIQFRETSAETERIKYNTSRIKLKVQKTLICSKSREDTAEWNWKFKKHWFVQSQEKAQLNPVEQQDSATLLLKSSKSLLQMHETGNYCKQTWETKSDISKYWAICVLHLFVNKAVTSQNLKLTLMFLMKPFRYMFFQGKNLNILRTKRAFEVT